jgi:hypothetical protein
MLSLKRLLGCLAGRRAGSRGPAVEGLESRQLLSTSPAVVGMQLIGPEQSVNRVVLTFNESVDPTTAQQPPSYIFGRIPPSGSNNGVSIGDVLGFPFARPKAKAIKDGKIQWSSAVYDDTTHSVTLTALKPFKASKYFRLLRVKGTGNFAIKDLAGNVLNGGTDTIVHWSYHNGKTLRFTDFDGDRAVITLKGPGHLYGFYRKQGDASPTIFITNTTAKSALVGAVLQGPTGDGVVQISQLLNAPANTNLFSSSHFVVTST